MSDGGAGRHVLLVRSSLQFLLATALAADLRQTTQRACRMLFVPDMLDPSLFLRAAGQWPQSPFDGIVTIDRKAGSAQVRRALRDALAEAQAVSLTVFNDREEVGQTALVAAARHAPGATLRCAEDGALAYTGFTYRGQRAATRWRQRLRVGRGWHDVRVLGTHPLVQQFIALHPGLLRPELRARPVQAFPASALASDALRSLAAGLCGAVGFDASSVPAGATVLTISHSSYIERNPDYRRMVAACTERLIAQRMPFFVKYHPRESHSDCLSLCAGGQAREIARTLPVECMYLMLRDRPLTVIGGMSTTLLTAGLLMPDVRCAALMHASGAGDQWDRRLLDTLGIEALADEAAVERFFDGLRT